MRISKFGTLLASLFLFACSDSGGDGGADSGGPSGNFCTHQCIADADCTVGGMDVGLTCVNSLCTGESSSDSCTSNDECIAELSGWGFGAACSAGGGECEAAMQVCLDVDGEGHCATAPSDFIVCADLMMDEVSTTDIDGASVVVCGQASAKCDAGACTLPCASDNDCASDAAPVCNVSSGACECGTDADCATIGNAAFSVCNAGQCGCGEAQHCIDGNAGDICNSGLCGCTGDMVCESVANPFDGGTINCVNF